jgi:hypothetical protein
MQKSTCAIEGCDKPSKCKRMCSAHYTRYVRNGDPGTAAVLVKGLPKQPCSIATCNRMSYVKGLCEMHYRRNRIHGDPEHVQPRTGAFNNYYRGDNIGSTAAHDRVKATRGPAREHACQWCGGQAQHWAYDHLDLDENHSDRAGPYSTDPSHYQPMCVPCHKRFDLDYLSSVVA